MMARASKKMDDLPEREAPDFEAMEANERRDQEAAEQLAAAKKIRCVLVLQPLPPCPLVLPAPFSSSTTIRRVWRSSAERRAG